MKRLLILLFSVTTFCAQAQNLPGKNSTPTQYRELVADSFGLAIDTLPPPTHYNMRTFRTWLGSKGDQLYMWSIAQQKYIPVGGPGGTLGVTSVGATINGSAIGITGSPVTSSGNISFGWTGLSNQYVKGNGSLGNFATDVATAGNPIFAAKIHSHVPSNIEGLQTTVLNWFHAGSGLVYDPVTGTFSFPGAGSGITSLNGLTDGVQTFNVGTSGSNFNISSVGSGHTFNLPLASATSIGKLDSADYRKFDSAYNVVKTGISATTLYTGDGSITGNRTVNVGSNNLDFNFSNFSNFALHPAFMSMASTYDANRNSFVEARSNVSSGGNYSRIYAKEFSTEAWFRAIGTGIAEIKATDMISMVGGAITSTTDTTNFKPLVINSFGQVLKSSSWFGSGGGSTPTLQAVTDVGSTTTNGITASFFIGNSFASADSKITLNVPGGSYGRLSLANAGDFANYIQPQAASVGGIHWLPNTAGADDTLATLADVRSGGGTSFTTTNSLKLTSGVLGTNTAPYAMSIASGSPVFDRDNSINQSLTLTQNATMTVTHAIAGDRINLIVTQDATGTRTLSLPTIGTITIRTTANSTTAISGYYDGTVWMWWTDINSTGGSSTLGGLSDVSFSGLANGDFIKYNGSSWVNRTAANVRSDLGLAAIATSGSAADLSTGTLPSGRIAGTATDGYVATLVGGVPTWQAASGGYTLPSLSTGSVIFKGSSDLSQNNTQLYWDNTNERLGVGTNAPGYKLDIQEETTTLRLHGLTSYPLMKFASNGVPNGAEMYQNNSNGMFFFNANSSTTGWQLDYTGNFIATHDFTVSNLATGLTAPSTSGTTKMVITDANGKLSFTSVPAQTISAQYTDASNTSTTETDLLSYTLPASQLASDGDRVVIEGDFTTPSNANNKTLRFYYGTYSQTWTSGTISSGVTIHVRATIVRTGSSAERISLEFQSAFYHDVVYSTATVATGSTATIKFTGQSDTASSDITQKIMTVTYHKAP